MKKFIIVLVFLVSISSVFAQDDKSGDMSRRDPFYVVNNSANRNENFYYINVSVERIYPSKDGYVIQYLCPTSTIATLGIPNEWFANAAGKAEIVKLPFASDWPTMTVFYVDGKFNHVRLYVHPEKSHATWGSLPQGSDVSKFFSDKEAIKLEF